MLILRGVDNDEKKDKESNVEYKTKDSTNESEENDIIDSLQTQENIVKIHQVVEKRFNLFRCS